MFAFMVLDIVSSVQKAKRLPGKNVSEINYFVSSGRKTLTHKMAKGMTRIGLQELFMLEENTKGTRGHSLKLAKMRCTRDCWRHFFLTE